MIKQNIFSNWNFFRILRLLLGVMIIVQAIQLKDWMYGLAGLLFSLMALFNTGCCSVNSCSTPPVNKDNKKEEVSFEEVK